MTDTDHKPRADDNSAKLECALDELQRGRDQDRTRTFSQRRDLARACLRTVSEQMHEWVLRSARAKQLPAGSDLVAEEWLSGPLPVARYLRFLSHSLDSLSRGSLPRLHLAPTGPEQPRRVRAAPYGWLDRLVLPGYQAAVEVGPGPLQQEPPGGGQGVHLVLGAGNVTSMPLCDALHAIFQRGSAVLLKASPLHKDLLAQFRGALRPLLDADLLRIEVGDADFGARALRHHAITSWHLTGTPQTLQTLLEDPRVAGMPWSAELGNVTAVVVPPGNWPNPMLVRIAREIASMFANNGACNCITPRLVLTCRNWPQRTAFLSELRRQVAALPPREPFHPGIGQRFARFANALEPSGPLPFVLRTDVDLQAEPHLGFEESFAPVLVETSLEAADVEAFFDRACGYLNEHTFGSLATHIFGPTRLLRAHRQAISDVCRKLPHGTIGLNTWAAINYSLMTTPWGSGGHNEDHATGRGFVHNTLFLANPIRAIVTGPPLAWPPAPWLPRRRRVAMARSLTKVHIKPSPRHLLEFAAAAMRP